MRPDSKHPAVAIPFSPGTALAQNSCGAGITPSILLSASQPPILVGDTVRIQLNVNVGAIQGGTLLNIPNVKFRDHCDTW